jgi:hypothetical protein
VKNKPNDINEEKLSIVSEVFIPYSKQEDHEAKKRREAILMTDMEKFLMFSRMLRRGIMFKNAVITHKPFPGDKE